MMVSKNFEAISELYGKELIAYGTGFSGKNIIHYLLSLPGIKLLGVTNSKFKETDAGEFEDTGLPMRSIQAWAKLVPSATILITATAPSSYEEICSICRDMGFVEILPASVLLLKKAADFMNTHVNSLAVQQLSNLAGQTAMIANPMLTLSCLANEVRDTHKTTFSEFKGCNKGKNVVVLGTGPTLDYYSQIDGVPHIGVNASFLKDGLKLDYYFLMHYVPNWCEAIKNHCFIKFFGCDPSNYVKEKFPEYIVEENHARRYFHNFQMSETIYANIEYYPLANMYSVIFAAIQFAMYTRPKRLFLVGCDCSTDGHFAGASQSGSIAHAHIVQKGYQLVKVFADTYYPDTEIISVNPVGLRGMFRDVYTESYLDAHLEIDRSTVEILNPAEYQKQN